MKTKREALIRLAKSWTPPTLIPEAPKPIKKVLEIEPLLSWTFKEELPKVQRLHRMRAAPTGISNAYAKIARMGEEMSLAGLDPNRYFVVPDITSESLPHNDALEVFDVVASLGAMRFFLSSDWDPLNDCSDLGDLRTDAIARALDHVTERDEQGRRCWRMGGAGVKALVIRHALLGGAPDWIIDPPIPEPVRYQNGVLKYFRKAMIERCTLSGLVKEEIEVDGYDRRAKQPFQDAYTKAILEPDPFWTLVERAEYEVWLAALDVLVAELAGRLVAHAPVPSPRPARPWETGDAAPRRVLPSRIAAWPDGRHSAGHWLIEKPPAPS